MPSTLKVEKMYGIRVSLRLRVSLILDEDSED
jgi:hypothetical protein